jgi:hypothetical protein
MAWDYTNDYSSTILAYLSGAGTITVVSVTGLPASGKYFILKVDDEYFLCTSYTGLVLTVTGGQAGSTPANHSLGAAITGCWIVPQVLDGIKSDVIASVALVLLEQHTASNSATLDFTSCISSSYDDYVIRLINVVPATNSNQLMLQFSSSGTYVVLAYSWTHLYNYQNASNGWEGSSSDSAIYVGGGQVASAGNGVCGVINLYNPGDAGTTMKCCTMDTTRLHTSVGLVQDCPNRGNVSMPAMDAFRFLFSTGNITSGTIRVYGVAKV